MNSIKIYAQIDDRFIDSNLAAISEHYKKLGNDSTYYNTLDDFNNNLTTYKNTNGVTEKYLLARGYYAKRIVDKDYEKAISIFNQSIETCNKNGFKRTGALISNDLANVYLNNGENKKALQIFLKNTETFKEVEDWGAYAWLLIDIGNIYNSDGYYERSREYYYKAKDVFEAHNEKNHLDGALAVCYQNLGISNEEAGNLDTAYYFYLKSLASRKRDKQYGNYSTAYRYLVNYFEEINQLDSSEYYIKKAIESDKKAGPNSHLINSYSMYIQFLQKNKRFDEAKNISLLSYKVAMNSSNDMNIYMAASNLAISYYYIGNLDSALYYSKISATKAKILNDNNGYLVQLGNIISILKKQGKLELTPEYYDELLLVKDKLHDNSATKLQLSNEMEKRDLDKQKFESENKRQELISLFLSIIMVLILIILAVITRSEIKRKKQNIYLKKTLAELQETTEHLNKTYSIVAHDLKGPLASVLGVMELLLDGSVDIEDWPEYLDTCYKALNQTHSLMINLLDWSRAKGDKLNFTPTEIAIPELVESSVTLHRHVISSKSISVETDFGNSTKVYGDKNMLLTVLRSLLSNAIKFTPEGGKIQISTVEEKEKVLLKIKDNGVGMTDKQINDALDINSYTTSIGTNDEKGSGLGLKLVIDMLERNNGKLEIISQVGKGSEFIAYLPKYMNNQA